MHHMVMRGIKADGTDAGGADGVTSRSRKKSLYQHINWGAAYFVVSDRIRWKKAHQPIPRKMTKGLKDLFTGEAPKPKFVVDVTSCSIVVDEDGPRLIYTTDNLASSLCSVAISSSSIVAPVETLSSSSHYEIILSMGSNILILDQTNNVLQLWRSACVQNLTATGNPPLNLIRQFKTSNSRTKIRGKPTNGGQGAAMNAKFIMALTDEQFFGGIKLQTSVTTWTKHNGLIAHILKLGSVRPELYYLDEEMDMVTHCIAFLEGIPSLMFHRCTRFFHDDVAPFWKTLLPTGRCVIQWDLHDQETPHVKSLPLLDNPIAFLPCSHSTDRVLTLSTSDKMQISSWSAETQDFTPKYEGNKLICRNGLCVVSPNKIKSFHDGVALFAIKYDGYPTRQFISPYSFNAENSNQSQYDARYNSDLEVDGDFREVYLTDTFAVATFTLVYKELDRDGNLAGVFPSEDMKHRVLVWDRTIDALPFLQSSDLINKYAECRRKGLF